MAEAFHMTWSDLRRLEESDPETFEKLLVVHQEARKINTENTK